MWEGACPRDGRTADAVLPDAPMSKCGRGLAPDGGLRTDQDVGSDRVHIRFCGHGCYGFLFYSGSLLKSAKVSKTLLPHHSAPRLGSVCPLSGLNPWAAAMGHPWPSAANPASCRVAHGFKPAFGQRGLTGRLRSKADQDQERLASHRGYGWALLSCVYLRLHMIDPPPSEASPLPFFLPACMRLRSLNSSSTCLACYHL
ncbi:Threonine synthase [Pseudomonas orientalis]|nr:Threonine synthase [Pseudomonas orientalis]